VSIKKKGPARPTEGGGGRGTADGGKSVRPVKKTSSAPKTGKNLNQREGKGKIGKAERSTLKKKWSHSERRKRNGEKTKRKRKPSRPFPGRTSPTNSKGEKKISKETKSEREKTIFLGGKRKSPSPFTKTKKKRTS